MKTGISLALKRSKIRFMLCFDPHLGVYIVVWIWGSCQKTVYNRILTAFELEYSGSPNPIVDIYPQMGSEQNIMWNFGRFRASRVGFKKIPMKNSHANLLFEISKKKLFFWNHISALRRSFRKNRVCGSIYSSRSIDSRTFFFLRVKIFMSTRSTKTLSLKIHVIFSEFRSFWSRKRNDNGSN